MRLPIPRQRLTPRQARRLACESCSRERDATDEEIASCVEAVGCQCGAAMSWKFAEGTRCPGCGRVGFWIVPAEYGDACSRVCHLQVRFRNELEGSRPVEAGGLTA